MANVRKSYAVYDSRPTYISASGTYGTLPYTPLGTAAGLPIERQKDPYMQFLTAYVAGDGVGLSFAPSATAVSEHVFRYYLGNTGGLSGSLLSGYGLLDISQSNEYLDLVGSLSRGTGTGSNFETAVDYVNEVVNRLHSDFPNMKWSVRGVPFNHYFLIPAPSTTASESSFGTGNYFHPQHPTGDVERVYDWQNAPTALAQFYRDRSETVLGELTSLKWLCPSGMLYFDNTYPFLKRTFDPETMYLANRECFGVATDFVASSPRNLKVLPIVSPMYSVRKHGVFDPQGGLTTGSSANATPSMVSTEMLRYQVLQPMKDSNCNGLVVWNNASAMLYSASLSGSTSEATVLTRNLLGRSIYGNNITDVDWTESVIKQQNSMFVGEAISDTYIDFRGSVQTAAGEPCCKEPDDPCVTTPCKCVEDGSGLTSCFDPTIGQDQCCTLAEKCAFLGVKCIECSCGGAGGSTVCQYSPGSPGDGTCPPDFVSVAANPNCGAFPCPICPNVECCCVSPGTPVPFKTFQGTYTPAATLNFRDLYLLPYGGEFGSNRINTNKNTYFLIPSVVKAIDPLGLTGQTHYLNTTGSIE